MRRTILAMTTVVAAFTVAACAPTDLPPGTPASPDVATGVREPTLRDPLGHTSDPVDRTPYSSELDGQGLPGPFDMVEDDRVD